MKTKDLFTLIKTVFFLFYKSYWGQKWEEKILQSYKKETPTQYISCDFCKMFKNNFFIEHLQVTASELRFLNFFFSGWKRIKLYGGFLGPETVAVNKMFLKNSQN